MLVFNSHFSFRHRSSVDVLDLLLFLYCYVLSVSLFGGQGPGVTPQKPSAWTPTFPSKGDSLGRLGQLRFFVRLLGGVEQVHLQLAELTQIFVPETMPLYGL